MESLERKWLRRFALSVNLLPLNSLAQFPAKPLVDLQEFKLHSFIRLKHFTATSVQSVTVQTTPRLLLLPAMFSSSFPTLAQRPNSCDSSLSSDPEFDPSSPSLVIRIQSSRELVTVGSTLEREFTQLKEDPLEQELPTKQTRLYRRPRVVLSRRLRSGTLLR